MYISEPCRDFLYTACLRCTATERLTATRKLKGGGSEPWEEGSRLCKAAQRFNPWSQD